jgi:hypothetical protein
LQMNQSIVHLSPRIHKIPDISKSPLGMICGVIFFPGFLTRKEE